MATEGSGTRQVVSGTVTPAQGVGASDSLVTFFSWEYLINCFANEKICISFGLWIVSVLFWMSSHVLLWHLRCQKRSWQNDSVLLAIYSFVGSMCNTVGALLSKQLTIQVFTGALMAAMDLLQFLLILYPMGALRSNFKSKSSSLLKKRKTKPRTSTFAVLFPLIAGTGYFYWASAALHSSAEFRGPRRQLLGNFLQNNTEIIGYALGIAAIIICWTSRIPLVSRAYKGRMFPGIMLWSHAFSVLASVLYAAAIVGHDKQLDFIIQTMPWLLLFLGSAALDTAILLLSCLMKCKFTQQLGLTAVVTTSDMEVLLQQVEPDTEDEKEDDDERQEKMQTESVKKKKLSWMPLNIVSKATSLQNCGSVGCYVGMIIEPVQEWQSDGEKKHWNLHTELQNEQETAWCSVQPNDSCVLTTSSEVIEHV